MFGRAPVDAWLCMAAVVEVLALVWACVPWWAACRI